MRRRAFTQAEEPLVVSQLLDPEAVVRRDGPKCAAWLVSKHRRFFRRDGAKLFKIPVDARTPPWFLVAVEFLKRRPGWNVAVSEARGERTYRVEWLRRGRGRRGAWLRS